MFSLPTNDELAELLNDLNWEWVNYETSSEEIINVLGIENLFLAAVIDLIFSKAVIELDGYNYHKISNKYLSRRGPKVRPPDKKRIQAQMRTIKKNCLELPIK
jgi:hypothetical protein